MSKKLPILSIQAVGQPEFQRWIIRDQKDRVWTGDRFSGQQRPALFAAHNQAAIDIQNILKSHFHTEPVRYVVPLFVEVYSDQPVDVAKVAQHLSRSARLYLDTPRNGNGPDGSLVTPWIEWHRIERLEGVPKDE